MQSCIIWPPVIWHWEDVQGIKRALKKVKKKKARSSKINLQQSLELSKCQRIHFASFSPTMQRCLAWN
ncbi:hypothetical protein ACOSQ2_002504 [Xanthoceras sorbifolium]